MTAEEFMAWNGRRYVEDPTGRAPFRAVEYGEWSKWVSDGERSRSRRDPEGVRLLIEQGVPVPEGFGGEPAPSEGSISQQSKVETRVSSAGSSGVSSLLEVVGWIGLCLSLLAGVVIVAQASSYGDGSGVAFGFVFGIAGSIQSLLLIAFARVLTFCKATAVLLAENLEQASS